MVELDKTQVYELYKIFNLYNTNQTMSGFKEFCDEITKFMETYPDIEDVILN